MDDFGKMLFDYGKALSYRALDHDGWQGSLDDWKQTEPDDYYLDAEAGHYLLAETDEYAAFLLKGMIWKNFRNLFGID